MNAVVVQCIVLILAAPLLQGAMKTVKLRMQGRPGPSPFQPYRDLAKLFHKEAIAAAGTSWLIAAAPGALLGTSLTFALLVPALADSQARTVDAIAIALTLALGRFIVVLVALDTRSGFEAMAASREMSFAALTEAPAIVALVAWNVGGAGVFAAAALFLVMLSEIARVPVDNQETHYELTMIHEGLLLEYSGWQLALLSLAAYIRQGAFIVLASIMLPGPLWAAPLWFIAIALLFVLVERFSAKVRLFEVPQLFGVALILALASLALGSGVHVW